MTGRPVPYFGDPPADGYEYVAVVQPADEWRVYRTVTSGGVYRGKRCRQVSGQPGRRACGRPAVAELLRPIGHKPGDSGTWWAYCEQHLYGRWVEDGSVMGWRQQPIGAHQ